MIIQGNSQNPPPAAHTAQDGPVLRWAKNDRTAGRIPVWGAPVSAREQAAQDLSYALEPSQSLPGESRAYRPQTAPAKQGEAFGFGDLLDIINPLQHIPVVGHVYRAITGDRIRSSSQIIGGAVFGGFIGAGAGLVNAIAENETGKDVTGNAFSMVSGEQAFTRKAEYKYTIAAYNAAKPRYNE